MSNGGDAKEEIPTAVVLSLEDRLGDKLSKLGAHPPTEEAKTPDAGTGFFSEIQRRLKRDCVVVDSISSVAHDVQRSLGNVNVPTP